MSKQIGLLTYHSAINYGALLQAYALEKKIRSFGVSCNLLDYRCEAVEDQYRLRSRAKCSSWQNFLLHNINCLCRRRRRRGFEKFWHRLSLSTRYTRATIGQAATVYDQFITGSDQVWNPACNHADPTYFLDFAQEGQKTAYSASLGPLDRFIAWGEEPLHYLAGFSSISLRETDAAAYLSSALGRACPHTVDPVWLLSAAEWESVADLPHEPKPYIFVYNLMDYPHMSAFVHKLSARMKLPVISISKSIRGDVHYFGTKIRSNSSPERFLGYIREAACVVTDSFHGTSFSMLFARPFFSALNPQKENTNSRLLSLLETAGLTNHAFTAEQLPNGDGAVDYAAVACHMQEPIAASLAYLKKLCQ